LSSNTSTFLIDSADGISLQDDKGTGRTFPSKGVNVTKIALANNDSLASGDYMDMRMQFMLVPRGSLGVPTVPQKLVTFLGVQLRGMSCQRQVDQSMFAGTPKGDPSNITVLADTCPNPDMSAGNLTSADSKDAPDLTRGFQIGQEGANASACIIEYCCNARMGPRGAAVPALAPAPIGEGGGLLLIAAAPEVRFLKRAFLFCTGLMLLSKEKKANP
jgi:hypothetical protein